MKFSNFDRFWQQSKSVNNVFKLLQLLGLPDLTGLRSWTHWGTSVPRPSGDGPQWKLLALLYWFCPVYNLKRFSIRLIIYYAGKSEPIAGTKFYRETSAQAARSPENCWRPSPNRRKMVAKKNVFCELNFLLPEQRIVPPSAADCREI